jgi:hypothetical protein
MARPPIPLVVKWRDLAAEGKFYAEIARSYPDYTASQIRHYCLGHTGRKAPGPLQPPRRFKTNPWLQGERSPHALLSEPEVRQILSDWDDDKGYWAHSASHWANVLDVSPSTILACRRGDTWAHLEHPNQGRKKEDLLN